MRVIGGDWLWSKELYCLAIGVYELVHIRKTINQLIELVSHEMRERYLEWLIWYGWCFRFCWIWSGIIAPCRYPAVSVFLPSSHNIIWCVCPYCHLWLIIVIYCHYNHSVDLYNHYVDHYMTYYDNIGIFVIIVYCHYRDVSRCVVSQQSEDGTHGVPMMRHLGHFQKHGTEMRILWKIWLNNHMQIIAYHLLSHCIMLHTCSSKEV